MTRAIAIIDIDGTVANVEHRRHVLDSDSPNRWNDFFAKAADDEPIPEGVGRAQQLSEDYDLVWLTGRPERVRTVTTRWLESNALPVERLVMHPDGDSRSSVITKVEQVTELAVERDIATIIEDDPRVVRALRAAGHPVEHAVWAVWKPSARQSW